MKTIMMRTILYIFIEIYIFKNCTVTFYLKRVYNDDQSGQWRDNRKKLGIV